MSKTNQATNTLRQPQGSFKSILALSDIKRPWGFLIIAALSVGLPAMIGAWLNQLETAIIASMGGLVIAYMPRTHITHRMTTLAICSFGLSASFALGSISNFNPYLSSSTLALTVFLSTFICRLFSVPPPGNIFFIVAACLARTLPYDIGLAAERTGMLLFGCMGGCLLALAYSLFRINVLKKNVLEPSAVTNQTTNSLTIESALTALFVAGAYLLALLMDFDNPYWVPISAAAIMQGSSLREVWQRKLLRIFGTVIGIGLAWVIFSMSPTPWQLAGLITLLSFIIEALITRNYGLAVIFITPLTVIFSDISIATINTNELILARLLDILLGSFVGFAGGYIIHHPRLSHR